MATDIWKKSIGKNIIRLVRETAWRLVEQQEMIATRKLVDSFDEYEILESLIESQKPTFTTNSIDLHPLLYTPFRYPPLKHGSRFGNRFEPSLWYGSLNVDASMSEKAFYRLNFLRGTKAEFGLIESQLTLFSCEIKTKQGVRLEDFPFTSNINEISSPTSYEASQQLGSNMRVSLIEAFTYQSARDPNKGLNIGLFSMDAFLHKQPNAKSFQTWQCLANKEIVEFTRASSITNESKLFPIQKFLVNNELPFPAN